MQKVVINPLTRVSGLLEIETSVLDNQIIDAKCGGMMFRGYEKMLEGRYPLDATYLTERICGICSTAHSVASTLALENALGITISDNDKMIRDFIHGAELLQNHYRHFYAYTLPDFVEGIPISPCISTSPQDFRIPKDINERIASHYPIALDASRLAHKLIAIVAGKAPHNHGIYTGGVTIDYTADTMIQLKSILYNIRSITEDFMIEDMNEIAKYYSDYYFNGGTMGNFISYGLFSSYQDKNISYVNPGVLLNKRYENLDVSNVFESVAHSWYLGEDSKPLEGELDSDPNKEDAYSFIKAPRYKGYAMETGPLARLWISGEYRQGISTIDRMMARVLETEKITKILDELLNRIQPQKSKLPKYEMPNDACGMGLTDTARGSLAHFVHIKDKVIDKYTIITPSVWNLSPMDSKGIHGVGESALIGTKIMDHFLEIGRIIRSFDPCVSCATHVINGENDIRMRIV